MKSQVRFYSPLQKKLFASLDDLNSWVEVMVSDHESQDLRGSHIKTYVDEIVASVGGELTFPCILFYDISFEDAMVGGIVFAEDFK